MGSTRKLTPGDRFGRWELVEELGEGGNGVVWKVGAPGEPDRALKLLRRPSSSVLDRFEAEIEALRRAAGISGVVPLVEHELPRTPVDRPRWFVMPLAGRFHAHVAGLGAVEVVEAFVQLADTLARLHALEIHHRDIKPANVLVLGGRLCLSDFGLVKYPSRKDMTPAGRDVGPKHTMAPEMRRHASAAAGGPADVFSFAKTLWIALTGARLGFDGRYSNDGVLSLSRSQSTIFCAPLDRLMSECTDDDPTARPGMPAVSRRLGEWVSLERDFRRRNLSEWLEVQNKLFPLGFPQRATWTGTDEICAVVRLLVGTRSLNHMFYPGGGGMTVRGVGPAGEPGLVSLDVGWDTILRPGTLSFESFGPASRWNYFRLDAEVIPPTGTPGAYLSRDGHSEELCQLRPGRYVAPTAWDDGEWQGKPLPAGARKVERYLSGSFVFFSTASPYNQDPSTYDARHQSLGADSFRDHVARRARGAP